MNKHKHLFTSESVTEGHPDKVADQISDAILDEIMGQDPKGRVACETLVTTGLALVAGEITTDCYADIPNVVRRVIRDIGYTDATYGFDFETCAVLTAIHEQSPDIAMGVDREGAGDQGMMFGYATRETPELMPLPIHMAHKLVRKLAEARKSGALPYLRPDGKSQVTVAYEGGKPVGVQSVVIAAQHHPDVSEDQLRQDVEAKVIRQVIPKDMAGCDGMKIYVNETGRFVIGGPQGDCGLTGRKIVVDTYGGFGSHGGGCLSGKDPTKVDRSGAYMARYVAKNVVAAGLADECEVQIAYAIGVAQPISVMVDTDGTGVVGDEELARIVIKHFDFRPRAIMDQLKLRRPIYRRTAAYGHFGREEEGFTWEIADRVADLKRSV
ncbi:MAG: methionine adenosyltransferase [bacterium]